MDGGTEPRTAVGAMCKRALGDTLPPIWFVQLIYNHFGSRNVLNEAFSEDIRPGARAIGPCWGRFARLLL